MNITKLREFEQLLREVDNAIKEEQSPKSGLEQQLEKQALLLSEQEAAIKALTATVQDLKVGLVAIGQDCDTNDDDDEEDYECDEDCGCSECSYEEKADQDYPPKDPFKPETGINMRSVYCQIQDSLRRGNFTVARNREDYESLLSYGLTNGQDYSNRILVILNDTELDQ